MAKIIICYCHHTDLEVFINNLTLSQSQAVFGGYIYVNLFNGTGGINNAENAYYLGSHGINFHDNRIYTIDYSRSIFNWFYL
jgi:archaellum component FlaF (FlaF/FlaG flagellin family)